VHRAIPCSGVCTGCILEDVKSRYAGVTSVSAGDGKISGVLGSGTSVGGLGILASLS